MQKLQLFSENKCNFIKALKLKAINKHYLRIKYMVDTYVVAKTFYKYQ